MGNLGNSRKFLVGSITPECCPNANSKFRSATIFFKLTLYSPKGYEKILGEYPSSFSKICIEVIKSDFILSSSQSIKYS